MKSKSNDVPKRVLFICRIVFSFLAFCFFLMGIMLALFPQFLTRMAGEQHPIVLGMLRGAGGSIIPYSLMYILIAIEPLRYRLLAYIVAIANIIAVILDFTSVYMKEYQLSYAMIDVPFEVLSLVMIVIFYMVVRIAKLKRETANVRR